MELLGCFVALIGLGKEKWGVFAFENILRGLELEEFLCSILEKYFITTTPETPRYRLLESPDFHPVVPFLHYRVG